jgi:uncharacterized membrane protein
VFLSSDPGAVVSRALPGERPMVSVFMPCTPNPTTGFFFYIAAEDVLELPISADEAAKLIMSAGLIQPEGMAPLAAMAEAARLDRAPAG